MTIDIEVVVLDELNCCHCGIRFGMAQPLLEARKKDFHVFYCPNGHAQSFVRPPKPRDEEMDDLRQQLASVQEELDDTRDDLATARSWADQVAASWRPLFRRPSLGRDRAK